MSFVEYIKNALQGLQSDIISHGDSVFGIDIGSSSIKVVQIKKKNEKIILETYGELPLMQYAENHTGNVVKLPIEKMNKAMVDIIEASNITSGTTGLSVSFSDSFILTIKLPYATEDELNKMVPIEAKKYIPIPTSDVTMDWFIINEENFSVDDSKSDSNKDVEILIVAIHNTTLNTLQSLMTELELEPEFYELEVFSAARSIIGHSVLPIALVDFGASSTNIYIIEDGIVRMSHYIKNGGQDMTLFISRALGVSFDAAEKLKINNGLTGDDSVRSAMLSTVDNIINSINRVLLDYEKKNSRNIERVVFYGGGAQMKGISEYASTTIDNEILLSNPFDKLSVPNFLQDRLKEIGPTFATALGVAIRLLK